ncbi:hypothetical protein GYH30_034726 [Glycine max]|uniref:Uncharacterized protein n=1 Tax=Glycine max TaxID=3847 RepID=K7LWL5_SOYBN|nr:hypothetical protein GYH30_034726 [Glycine max]
MTKSKGKDPLEGLGGPMTRARARKANEVLQQVLFILFEYKPKFQGEKSKVLDRSKRTPLHLAFAKGHIKVVHVLLHCKHACLMNDQYGRIPLHYTAMRGRMEIARELIGAKPESLMMLDGSVQVGDVNEYFLNFGDSYHGNTILHLAFMLKQIETVRYLLSISKIREEANIKKMGYTALDMLEHGPKDTRSLQIQIMLMDVGFKNNERNQLDHPPSTTTLAIVVPSSMTIDPNEKYWSKFLKRVNKFLQLKSNRLEEMRGMLSLISTMISTVTFGVVMNLPGGNNTYQC